MSNKADRATRLTNESETMKFMKTFFALSALAVLGTFSAAMADIRTAPEFSVYQIMAEAVSDQLVFTDQLINLDANTVTAAKMHPKSVSQSPRYQNGVFRATQPEFKKSAQILHLINCHHTKTEIGWI